MSLKGNLIGTAGGFIADKLSKVGSVDTALNGFINKIGKVSGMKTSDMEKKANKHYLYFKSGSYSVGSMVKMLNKQMPKDIENLNCKYKVYDENGNLKYFSDYDTCLITDKDTITLYDSNKKRLGKVKQHLFGMGLPFVEKDTERCTVYLNEEVACELKSYEMFKEKCIDTIEGKIHISFSEDNKYEFEIKKENQTIAVLNQVPLQLKDGYIDKYIIEYSNIEDEIIIVLIAIALDIIY